MAMTASFENDTLTLASGEGLTITGKIEDGEFKFRSPLSGTEPLQEWPFLRIQDGGGHVEFNKVGSLPSGLTIETADGLLVVHDS